MDQSGALVKWSDTAPGDHRTGAVPILQGADGWSRPLKDGPRGQLHDNGNSVFQCPQSSGGRLVEVVEEGGGNRSRHCVQWNKKYNQLAH